MDEPTRQRVQSLLDTARASLLDRRTPLAAVVGTCLSIAQALGMAPEERWLQYELQGYKGERLANLLGLPYEHSLVDRVYRYRVAESKFFVQFRNRLVELPYVALNGQLIADVEKQAQRMLAADPLQQWQATRDTRVSELAPEQRDLLVRMGIRPDQVMRLHFEQDLPLQITEGLRSALGEFLADEEWVLLSQGLPKRPAEQAPSITIGKAPQVIIGDHGTQVLFQNPGVTVSQVFNDLRTLVESRIESSEEEKKELPQKIAALQEAATGPRTDLIGGARGREESALALSKLGELTMGAAANALGGGIIEGIKLALAYWR